MNLPSTSRLATDTHSIDALRTRAGTDPKGAAKEVAGAITPVPGGVGAMTIVCLMHNTLIAACAQNGLPLPTAL